MSVLREVGVSAVRRSRQRILVAKRSAEDGWGEVVSAQPHDFFSTAITTTIFQILPLQAGNNHFVSVEDS